MDTSLDSSSSASGPPWRNCSGQARLCDMESDVSYVDFYLHQPLVAAVFIVSYLLIFLLCMIGNGVVCFIVLQDKHMRSVTNLFILNLAVSDLLVGIFCMPTTLLDNIISGEWHYSWEGRPAAYVLVGGGGGNCDERWLNAPDLHGCSGVS